jgi:photosystem II stability/assembly factor-like uncharacterized protein
MENEQTKRFLPFIVIGALLLVIILVVVMLFSGKEKSDEVPEVTATAESPLPTPPATPPAAPAAAPLASSNLTTMVYKDSVLRSTDGGETFETYFKIATTSRIGIADVLSIAFHPLTKDKVVVTTYQDGLFFNAGRENEWAPISFPPKQIYSFILDKKNPDHRVFASGVVDKNGRIFRTDTAGENWKAVYAEPGQGTYVSALAQHPKKFLFILAGTSGGTLIKSLDGGDTWVNVGQKISGVISNFGFDSAKESFMYLLAYQSKIYHSTNSGNEWLNWEEEKVKEVNKLKEQAVSLTKQGDKVGAKRLQDQATALVKRNTENKAPSGAVLIVADPIKSGTIYAGTTNGLYRSTDYGKYWNKMNIIESAGGFSIRSIAINPKNAKEISFVSGKTFYKSTNDGVTWATVPLDNSRNASFVAYDPFDTKTIFIGMSSK